MIFERNAFISNTNLEESAETHQQAYSPEPRPLNNHQRRAAQYGKIGKAITDLEKDWRAFRGESPNPWRKIESVDDTGKEAVMQIMSRRGLSKLELRSIMRDAYESDSAVKK